MLLKKLSARAVKLPEYLSAWELLHLGILMLIILPPQNGGGYNGLALSRLSACLHYRVHSINPIPIEGVSSNLA